VINLVVQKKLYSLLVSKIKALFYFMYNFYLDSLKHHLEICKLAKLLKLKAFKILKNVKTQWISMLSPTKQNFTKYKSMVVNMFEDQGTNTVANANLDMLCDVENFLGLAYIILLLECVQNLSKFGHTQDVLICDFVSVVKVCEVDINVL
jgi:hypothetical protein